MKTFYQKSKSLILLLFCAVMCMAALAGDVLKATYTSTALEASKLLPASTAAKLYNLNVYNSSGSTVYLQVFDSYTVGVPATANTVPGDWNFSTGVVTTEETHATWATGTRFLFAINGVAGDISLKDGKQYYLIKLTQSTFKIANSLANALATNALTITGANAATGYTMQVGAEYLPPVAIATKATGCVTYNGGHLFRDGIWVTGSSTDTTYTAAGVVLRINAVYGQ